MVYAPPRKWQQPRLPNYSDTATSTFGTVPFSVDNELLTTERMLVQNRTAPTLRKPYVAKEHTVDDSEMMLSGEVVPFRKPKSEGTLDELLLQLLEAQSFEVTVLSRDILVKHERQVLFSKEIFLSPQQLRKSKPKVLVDDRFLDNDDD